MMLINGVPQTLISASDRGLAYGDGLFETIAVVDGVARHWERHLNRLASGANRLGIAAPSPASWNQDLSLALGTKPPQRGVLKLTLTRGSGARGYAPPEDGPPSRIVGLFPWPEWPSERYASGINVMLCQTRLAQNPALAGIKHLNRLEQVLAASEVARQQADDGFMFALDDRLIESTRANVFLVFGQRLITPRINDCGVAGVMRELLLDYLPKAGFDLEESTIDVTDLTRCDEVFLTNSLIGLWPVRQILGLKPRLMGPAPVTRRIRELLAARRLLP